MHFSSMTIFTFALWWASNVVWPPVHVHAVHFG